MAQQRLLSKVGFSGLSARSGPLAFGLTNLLRAVIVDDDPSHLNLTSVLPVPDGTGLGEVEAAVGVLLERHESLRTTYRIAPGIGPDTVQVVAGEGSLDLLLVEADGDPAETGIVLGRELRTGGFDLEADLPVRLAVVLSGGAPALLVCVVCHTAMDATSWEILVEEWAALMDGRELPAAAALQPIDVVALEERPSVRRLTESSLSYWDARMRAVPQAAFALPGLTDPAEKDWHHTGLRIVSERAAEHLGRIAERTGVSRSVITLAAFGALVARRVAEPDCAITSLSANRVVKELRGYFGTLAQDAMLLLDTAAPETFDQLARECRAEAMRAYRASWFDPIRAWEVINGVGAQRGISFARDLVFNDMSALGKGAAASAGRRFPSVRTPGEGKDRGEYDETLDLRLDPLPAELVPSRLVLIAHRLEDRLDLGLWADPQVLTAGQAAEFGRSFVRLLAAAADGDLALDRLPGLTALTPVRRGADWVRSDRCWVDLVAVRRLAADVLGDRPHLVLAEPDERLGHRLVCHLAAPVARPATGDAADDRTDDATDDADLAGVHRRMLDLLPGRPSAITPQWYIAHTGPAPDAPGADAADAWRALPVLTEGPGR
ncbi:condensation domain-containing protein [Kitasatospora sp. NPDC059327]|uniref:condensation domain-containing protein n=1 Tax=Kitasatospora sp. NPDC059327 TaxID=3346803 RepID=UPI0036AE3D1C